MSESDDFNEEEFAINPEDVIRVIDLDENQPNGFDDNNVDAGYDENIHGDVEYSDEDDHDDAMETGEASAAPTQDDSVLTFSGHQNDSVICCQMHPVTSDIVITGGQDDRALVWNTKTGAVLFECTGHSDTVNAVGFSSDGTMVASADMKGFVHVWAVPSGSLVWSFEVGEFEWLQWHQVAPVLLAGTKDGQVWMWKVPSGDCKIFASHGSGALCGKILPDGKHCCVGYEDGVVKIWDMKEAEAVYTISGHDAHSSSVLCMDVKSEGNLAVTGSEDMTAKLISLANGKVLSTLQCGNTAQAQADGTDSVETVGLSAVNDYAAAGTLSGSLQVWDLPTKSIRHRYEHPYGIVKVQWSLSSPNFYTACLDGCVRQFDSRSGQMVRTWQGHALGILDLCLAKDESLIVTASDDFTAKVFSHTSQT